MALAFADISDRLQAYVEDETWQCLGNTKLNERCKALRGGKERFAERAAIDFVKDLRQVLRKDESSGEESLTEEHSMDYILKKLCCVYHVKAITAIIGAHLEALGTKEDPFGPAASSVMTEKDRSSLPAIIFDTHVKSEGTGDDNDSQEPGRGSPQRPCLKVIQATPCKDRLSSWRGLGRISENSYSSTYIRTPDSILSTKSSAFSFGSRDDEITPMTNFSTSSSLSDYPIKNEEASPIHLRRIRVTRASSIKNDDESDIKIEEDGDGDEEHLLAAEVQSPTRNPFRGMMPPKKEAEKTEKVEVKEEDPPALPYRSLRLAAPSPVTKARRRGTADLVHSDEHPDKETGSHLSSQPLAKPPGSPLSETGSNEQHDAPSTSRQQVPTIEKMQEWYKELKKLERHPEPKRKRNLMNEIKRMIDNKAAKGGKPLKIGKKPGIIYVATKKKKDSEETIDFLFKIGKTERTLQGRHRDSMPCVGPIIAKSATRISAFRIETLIKLDLAPYRVQFTCGCCQRHNEFFLATREHILNTVELWLRFAPVLEMKRRNANAAYDVLSNAIQVYDILTKAGGIVLAFEALMKLPAEGNLVLLGEGLTMKNAQEAKNEARPLAPSAIVLETALIDELQSLMPTATAEEAPRSNNSRRSKPRKSFRGRRLSRSVKARKQMVKRMSDENARPNPA